MMIVETPVFVEIGFLVGRVFIRPNCLRPSIQWIQSVTDTNVDELREGPLEQIVVVTREEGE